MIKLSFISPSLRVHADLAIPYLFLQSSESFGTKRVTIPHLCLALDLLPEELKPTGCGEKHCVWSTPALESTLLSASQKGASRTHHSHKRGPRTHPSQSWNDKCNFIVTYKRRPWHWKSTWYSVTICSKSCSFFYIFTVHMGTDEVYACFPPHSVKNFWHVFPLKKSTTSSFFSFAQQLENYIQQKTGMVHIQADAVHNQTATMLEIGTNLLTQTAEQTRKLTVVEAKVTAFHIKEMQWCILLQCH